MALGFWKRFARMFRPRINSLVGVDFGEGAIKVAEVNLSAKIPLLKTLAIVDLPMDLSLGFGGGENAEPSLEEDTVAALARRLRRTLSANNVKTRYAVLAVGVQMIFVREVVFPRIPAKELAEAIKWDIPKYVPYEDDSYEFDYAITGTDAETGNLRVLIVAAPKTLIRQVTDIARRAGLTPIAIDIEPLAIYRTLSGAENSMVIDFGQTASQITLFQQGHPIFTRIVTLGGARLAAALSRTGGPDGRRELEEFMEELGQEVQRTAHFLQLRTKNAAISRVFVSGLTEPNYLVQELHTRTGLEVAAHDPLKGLQLHAKIKAAQAQRIGPQMTVAVGLALRGNEP